MSTNQSGLDHSELRNIEYDYIEYYVGMAKMVVYWHVKAMGFKVVAYSGPETGTADRCSYYITKNNIKLVITSASQPSSYKIVSFVDLHGNGIKKIGISVSNVKEYFKQALENGAVPSQHPTTTSDENGSVEEASFKLFDDNEIVLINYGNYKGVFKPGYSTDVQKDWLQNEEDSELEKVDHIACALRFNEITLWENYLNSILGLSTVGKFDERQQPGKKKIGMLLKVLQSDNKQINNVLVEPDNGVKSQVQLFIDQNYGAGIQHVAFASNNIFKSVQILKTNGVKFTTYPDSYYDQLAVKYPDLDVKLLQKNGVLCDVLDKALLLQVFTSPLGDRATFFYEIVQRVNDYDGFGLDNIRALFDSLETELVERK